MNVCRVGLAILSVLLSNTASASKLEDFVGEWSAAVTAQLIMRYTAEITISLGSDGRLSATARYPELGCSTELKQKDFSMEVLEFKETVTSGQKICADGTVQMAFQKNGALRWVRLSKGVDHATLVRPSVEQKQDALIPRPDKETVARYEATAARLDQQFQTLFGAPSAPYPNGHDFGPLMQQLQRDDTQSLAMGQLMLYMPEYHQLRKVIVFSSTLADRYDVDPPSLRSLVANHLKLAQRELDDVDSLAIARLLRWHREPILRLHERAAGGDADAGRRYREVVALAYSTPWLRELMQLSLQYRLAQQQLGLRYDRLEKAARERGVGGAELERGFRILAVLTALNANDVKSAQQRIGVYQAALDKELDRLGRAQFLGILGGLFGGSELPSGGVCPGHIEPRYHPSTGEYLGEAFVCD